MTGGVPGTGLACPIVACATDVVQLGHGSGGKLSADLLREHILPHLAGQNAAALTDAAVLPLEAGSWAFSTDTHVVAPLEFPGGDIGALSVHGTCNDLAMMGARPACLAVGLVLEEGLPLALLDRVLESLGAAARGAGVRVVTGDTKVVERGKADGMFITTTGIGRLDAGFAPAPARIGAGDAVLVSGPIGRHGVAVMAAREQLGFETDVVSDSADLWPLVERLRTACPDAVHALRDPTRGGLASALNELAASARVGVELEERAIPVPGGVAGVCEMLGLDPLYVANEGVLVAFVAERWAGVALEAIRSHPLGAGAVRIGGAVAAHPGLVTVRTAIGSARIVGLLPGDQLPRIC